MAKASRRPTSGAKRLSRIVGGIEREVQQETGQQLDEPRDSITVRQRRSISFGEIAKPMIAGSYLGSAVVLVVLTILFVHGSLGLSGFMALLLATFFLASAGASSAYLTVSESSR